MKPKPKKTRALLAICLILVTGLATGKAKIGKHMHSKLHAVTDSSFETDINQSPLPVLVDFWAEWCRPCHMISPILEETAVDYEGKLKILKLNVDDNPQAASKYGIRGIPTLMIFKGGKMIASRSGTLSKSQLAEFIDSNI